MKAPIVQEFMTRLPLEIEQIDNVLHAKQLMDLFGIRHVPVMKGLRIRGIVSQSDILQATIRAGANVDNTPIEQVCQHDVLTVDPLTTVDEVSRKMLQRHVGSAVVVDGGYVVGIFTKSDALKTLTRLFGPAKSS
jgi:acetoin utilization protein AcuB